MTGGDFLVATIAAYMCFATFSRLGYSTGLEHELWEFAPKWEIAALVGLFFAILMYFTDFDALERKNVSRSMFAVLASGAASFSGTLILVMLLSDALLAHRRF